MTESLRRLLQHPIDYAGLYPPASLDMRGALAEYGTAMDSEEEWILNRFLCPADKLADCFEALGEFEDKQTGAAPWIDFGVIGTPLESGEAAMESLKKNMSEVKLAFQHGDVTTFEVKLPLGDQFAGCVAAVAKSFNWFDERDVEVYVELPWGPGRREAMAELASQVDGVGFKARLGGPKPENFPDTREVATFIGEVAGLESMFKFTAGLHLPLRNYDSDVPSYQHGFVNVMVASAIATIQSASTDEVDEVLAIQDPSAFIFTDKTIEIGDHKLSLKDIDEWWLYFGGFGSCSFKEPIEGLRTNGWL